MWNGKKMFCAMWLKISLLISKIFHITRLLLMCAQDKRHVLCLCFWETCHSMPKTHHFMSLAKSFWITHIQTHIWETKNWLKRNPNMLVRYWKSNKNLNQIEADGWTLATVIFMMRHYEFRICHCKYYWERRILNLSSFYTSIILQSIFLFYVIKHVAKLNDYFLLSERFRGFARW